MKYLTLDCATATGWACGSSASGIESGVQEFDLRRGESPGMRFLRFRQWLHTMIRDTGAEVVIFEQAHHRGGSATELCVGFTTRVQEVAAELGREYKSVHSATLKRHATGSGAAKKPQMMAAASTRFGRAITDDNEADALLMLGWALDGMPESESKKPARKKTTVADRRAGA